MTLYINSMYRKTGKLILAALSGLILAFPGFLSAQTIPASPANWLFPDGNAQGTRRTLVRSSIQELDSIKVKWSTPSISGDVKPLIGNVINNNKISGGFTYGPNEITAVMGDKLVVVDAMGRTHPKAQLPAFVKNVSVLFDSLATTVGELTTRHVVMGLETIEFENLDDSLAFAYIAGYNSSADTVGILKRLAIDLRDYDPNIFASIKPVMGRRRGNNTLVYATVNMSEPQVGTSSPGTAPFFRGFTQFNTGSMLFDYPLPDVGDDFDSRITLGPEVGFAQPSFSSKNGDANIILPNYPTMTIDVTIDNLVTDPTYPNESYLFGFDVAGALINEGIYPRPMSSMTDPLGNRPVIRPYYVDIKDARNGDSIFILVSEGYKGIEGSEGTARLHLYNTDGDAITLPTDVDIAPPFIGGEDHDWSVAVGDVDGNSSNEWLPYFPNNAGNEIIVSQSTREFAFPGNKVYILRYYSGSEIDKPSPPNTYLYHLDTLASQRINGWVAAVNDLDADPDGKEEILLVDGSKLTGVRLRDYDSYEFRIGRPFDTVFTFDFNMQSISSVAVADMEGDGMNDIIVTTYDSTYVIGTVMIDIINVIEPSDSASYCAGDTILFKWENLMMGQDYVNISFEAVTQISGTVTGLDTILIEENYPNNADTVMYEYVASDELFGKSGRIIVASSYNPTKVSDESASFTIYGPVCITDTLPKREYQVGELIEFTGMHSCIDSVSIFTSYSSSTFWDLQYTGEINTSGTFSIAAALPSATFFECLSEDPDSLLNINLVGFRDSFRDTSQTHTIRLHPAPFPVTWDTSETSCPNFLFHWDPMDIDYLCDSVSISVSVNGGTSWTWINTAAANEHPYLWRIPLALPDSILMRFCCENSCVRTDTIIKNYQPKYIDIVSPNPFSPVNEELTICYKVPEETNVTIRIFDAANRIIAEPVRSQPRNPGTAYCDTWNGYTANGSPAANGMYYLSIEFSNGSKEIYHVFIRK